MSPEANLPQVIPPAAAPTRAAYVDFVFGLDYLSVNSTLLRIMHHAMAAYGLSCLLVNNSSIEQAHQEVRKGRLRPLVYLDLCSEPGNRFYELIFAMADKGVHTFCDPKTLPWTLKADSHGKLEAAGLPLPPSVIFRKTDPDRDLTPEEIARVGERVVIKPSFGVAGLGVVVGAFPNKEQIGKARDYNRKYDWLVQKMIRWGKLDGTDRQAYLRGYNVLGHRTLMWWSNDRGYHSFTWNDLNRYDLHGAVEIMDRIAAVTGVEYFSTEIAICADAGPDRFCLIDYINDQCDIDPQAQPDRSPPESWVRWVCQRFAEFTFRKKHNLPPNGEGTLYLGDAA
jgi:hypothetical protein